MLRREVEPKFRALYYLVEPINAPDVPAPVAVHHPNGTAVKPRRLQQVSGTPLGAAGDAAVAPAPATCCAEVRVGGAATPDEL